jgi:catechol 2,3-dioxygenase-like lactoylglutathione lyase family enzyme
MPTNTAPIDLDHVTIVTDRLQATRDVLVNVIGLEDGHRPPFGVDGHWIYANNRPAIHLVAATVPAGRGRVTPRIDHVAFRVRDAAAWDALVARVRQGGLRFATADVPQAGERQLFVEVDPTVVIEFVSPLPQAAA